MKKWMLMVCALIMIFALTACKANQSSETTESNKTESNTLGSESTSKETKKEEQSLKIHLVAPSTLNLCFLPKIHSSRLCFCRN